MYSHLSKFLEGLCRIVTFFLECRRTHLWSHLRWYTRFWWWRSHGELCRSAGFTIVLRIWPSSTKCHLPCKNPWGKISSRSWLQVKVFVQDIWFFFYLAFKENTSDHSSKWQHSWCQKTMVMPPGVFCPCHTGHVSLSDLYLTHGKLGRLRGKPQESSVFPASASYV